MNSRFSQTIISLRWFDKDVKQHWDRCSNKVNVRLQWLYLSHSLQKYYVFNVLGLPHRESQALEYIPSLFPTTCNGMMSSWFVLNVMKKTRLAITKWDLRVKDREKLQKRMTSHIVSISNRRAIKHTTSIIEMIYWKLGLSGITQIVGCPALLCPVTSQLVVDIWVTF